MCPYFFAHTKALVANFAGPVLAGLSRGRAIFPCEENCAWLLGLALARYHLAGEPCPLGLRYTPLKPMPSHPQD